MTDPETTIPPRQPNTLRTLLHRFTAWRIAQVSGAAIVGAIVAAFIAGAVLF